MFICVCMLIYVCICILCIYTYIYGRGADKTIHIAKRKGAPAFRTFLFFFVLSVSIYTMHLILPQFGHTKSGPVSLMHYGRKRAREWARSPLFERRTEAVCYTPGYRRRGKTRYDYCLATENHNCGYETCAFAR